MSAQSESKRRIAALVGRAGSHAGWDVHFDHEGGLVAATDTRCGKGAHTIEVLVQQQILEGVVAVCVGLGHQGDDGAIRVGDLQGDFHTDQTAFASILDAVFIGIVPDEVADGARIAVVAEVSGGVVLPAGHA